MTDELRAKFEVWATIERRSNLERDPLHNDEYNYRSTDTAWKAWNAAYVSRDAEVEALTRDSADFKNFHRLLCERFGYGHDEKDWRRDQLSLIEHIAAMAKESGE